ncbi:MAG: hypothetical protein PHU25_01170 [Deltaproteobacteria bacterium]|nr:hypothetical protein [Deltaproteobacteria bacterium]
MAIEAAVVSAIGGLVASRAEKELMQWFVDAMLNDLCGEVKVRNLLPKVCALHDAINTISIPSKTALVAAFRDDIEQLPERLLLDSTFSGEDGKASVKIYIQVFEGIRRGYPPLEIVAGLGSVEKLKKQKCDSVNTECVLLLVGLTAQAYLDVGGNESGYNKDNFKRVLENKLDIVKDKDIRNRLDETNSPNNNLFDELSHALESAKIATSASQETMTAERFSHRALIVLTLMEDITESYQKSNLVNPRARNYLIYSATALSAAKAKHYSDALVPMLQIISEAEKGKPSQGAVVKLLQRYLPLAVDIAAAETSADIQTALEDAAQPVGGWRLKKTRPIISIGALVGVSPEWEFGFKDDSLRQTGFVVSVFAPVGVDLSWPLEKGTGGFFISLIDVGSLVGIRVVGKADEDVKSVEQLPEPGFAQVFSPGLYGRFGLGHTPLVFSFGGAYSPELRRMTLQTGATEIANVVRLQLALAVDVMLIPF